MNNSRFSFHIFSSRESYLMVAASMFLGLFVRLILQGMISGIEDNELLDRMVMIFGEIAILLPPLFILNQRKLSMFDVLPLKRVSLLTVGMSILFIGGVIGLLSVFEALVVPYFPLPDFLSELDETMFDGGILANMVLILAAVVIAPLVEEFIFRGLLQQSLFYHYGSHIPALVIPTIIFALFHVGYLFYLPAMLELLALGVLLAWLMSKTGNILVPMLSHALFNLSAFSGLFIGNDNELSTISDLGAFWIIVSTILFVLGWIYFKSLKIVVSDEVFLIPLPHELEE